MIDQGGGREARRGTPTLPIPVAAEGGHQAWTLGPGTIGSEPCLETLPRAFCSTDPP